MTRRHGSRGVALAMLLALAAGACRSGAPPDEEPTGVDAPSPGTEPGGAAGAPTGGRLDGTLRIGTLLPQTGDLAALGPSLVEAVRLAVEHVNEAGGVLGKDAELVIGDSGTDEQNARQTVDDLLGDAVDVIVGAASARVTLAVMDRVTRSRTVMCSPANTGLQFTSHPSDRGFYFRTPPPDGLQAQALANQIVEDGHRRIAVVAIDDDYGQPFSTALTEALGAHEDVRVVATATYPPAAAEFGSYVRGLPGRDPDAVAIVAFEDTGGPVLRALVEEELGPAQVGVYAPDAMQSSGLGDLASPEDPSVAQGVRGTAPFAQGTGDFPDAFEAFAPEGTPDIFSSHAYDCVVIMALAALETNTDDPVAISRAMNGITGEGEKCTSFEQCKQLIEEGQDIDYDGASGELEFTEAGEPGIGTYELWEYVVRDGVGAIETIGTFTVARPEDDAG